MEWVANLQIVPQIQNLRLRADVLVIDQIGRSSIVSNLQALVKY